jgi:tetraacyldisaccharide 4'-kinase
MRELEPTPLTIPLSWIYGGLSSLYHGAYDRGIRKTIEIGRPVISVGNLVVGGTGKTPVVLALAQTLIERGLVPAILTRGYGGSRTGLLRDGRWDSGEGAGMEAGDEPLHLSRSLPGVTLGVGKHRAAMGRRILGREPVDVFLLDDGFQHRELARETNVLLLDAEAPFGNNRLLPAGPLREPRGGMHRATAILLTGGDGSVSEATRTALREFSGPIWTTQVRLDHFETLSGEKCPQPQRPVMAVGGIARPGRLYDLCQASGLELIGQKSFPDHYPYRKADVRELESMTSGATLMTTAKDAVRLAPLVTAPGQWCVAAIRIEIDGGWDAFLERVLPDIFPQKKGAAPRPLPSSRSKTD